MPWPIEPTTRSTASARSGHNRGQMSVANFRMPSLPAWLAPTASTTGAAGCAGRKPAGSSTAGSRQWTRLAGSRRRNTAVSRCWMASSTSACPSRVRSCASVHRTQESNPAFVNRLERSCITSWQSTILTTRRGNRPRAGVSHAYSAIATAGRHRAAASSVARRYGRTSKPATSPPEKGRARTRHSPSTSRAISAWASPTGAISPTRQPSARSPRSRPMMRMWFPARTGRI